MTYLLLALRFLIELCLFAAWAFVGYSAVGSGAIAIVAAVALALISAALWGLLLSPRRRIDLALPIRVAIELALFVGAGAALALLGHPLWGLLLVVAELVTIVALALLGFRPGQDAAAPRS